MTARPDGLPFILFMIGIILFLTRIFLHREKS